MKYLYFASVVGGPASDTLASVQEASTIEYNHQQCVYMYAHLLGSWIVSKK